MRVASAMQFELCPEDEGVLAAIPTKDLIEELVELQSRAIVVIKALGDELNRTQTVVVPKLKAELEESTSSLKSAIKTTEICKEEMQKKDGLAKEEQEVLKATLAKVMAERDQLLKEKDEAEAKGESLAAEMEKCQECMMRINEESFNQGLRQIALFHGIPVEDSRYDLGKDVVNGQLMSLGKNADYTKEDIQENAQPSEANQQDQSVEGSI